MDYTSLHQVCERAVDIGAKVGAGEGFVGMALLAATDEDLRTQRNGVVIYDAVIAGIFGGIAGGLTGSLVGGVLKEGLEYLAQR